MAENIEILQQGYQDTLENLVANLGTSQDKRSHSRFVNNKWLSATGNRAELDALYRTDWLAGKIVDIIPDDMTREWRSFVGDLDPITVEQLAQEESRLGLRGQFNLAHKWARLYGTSFIVISVDDGMTPDQPLAVDKLKPGSLRHIKAIDRHRVSTADVVPVSDPMHKDFGLPQFYRFNETNIKVHHSRVLRFDGVQLPFDEFRRNNYNSDSILSRLYEPLTNLNTVANAAASMVYETNVDIVKVKNLMGYLHSAEGQAAITKRFSLASMLKSMNNIMLLDSEEDLTTKTNTFSGLPDLMDRYALFMSAASDIPATRLMGSSASGLNATGEGDLKNYVDTVRARQQSEYKPKLDYFDAIMFKSLGLPEDSDMRYEFNSLFQMTEKEVAEIQFTKAQRDALYLDRDVISELIVAKELKQEGTYTNITDEDIQELEAMPDDFDANINSASIDPEQGVEAGPKAEGSRNQEPKEPRSSVSEPT